VCGPFAARGAKGEEEYPQHWLGGTGEVSTVGERELHGARGRHSEQANRQRYSLFI
jgi:hypothetical protein